MYCLNETKMFYDLADNQVIIIDSSTGYYYALNALGSIVFDFLARGADRAVVLAELQNLSNAPQNTDEMLSALEQYLLQHEILVFAQTTADIEVSFAPELVANGFSLDIDQFDDAQEIMLADPVHDVDLDAGWPSLKQSEE